MAVTIAAMPESGCTISFIRHVSFLTRCNWTVLSASLDGKARPRPTRAVGATRELLSRAEPRACAEKQVTCGLLTCGIRLPNSIDKLKRTQLCREFDLIEIVASMLHPESVDSMAPSAPELL